MTHPLPDQAGLAGQPPCGDFSPLSLESINSNTTILFFGADCRCDCCNGACSFHRNGDRFSLGKRKSGLNFFLFSAANFGLNPVLFKNGNSRSLYFFCRFFQQPEIVGPA